MIKKLLTVWLALVAFAALALPGAASASPVLTENGVAVATGAGIKGVQFGTSKFTSTAGATQLECSTGQMSGEVIKNNGTEIEARITSAIFGGTGAQATGEPKPECTSGSGFSFGNTSVTAVVSSLVPWCIRSEIFEDSFQISGGSCPSGETMKFKLVTTLAGTCEYQSTGSLGGSFNTGGIAAILTTTTFQGTENGFRLISGGFVCPTSMMLNVKIELETAAGGKLTIS